MNMNTLIFDRTQADVDRVKELNEKAMAGTLSKAERTEWGANMKGAYNNGDINRVCSAVRYIADRMKAFPTELDSYRLGKQVYKNPAFEIPYDVAAVTVNPKTDWTMFEFMNDTDMESYIADISTLRGILSLPNDTPETPATGQRMTFRQANAIEKILFDVNAAFEQTEAIMRRRVDLAAAVGTTWQKYYCTKEVREVHEANETEWLPSEVQTDPNASLTATGYQSYRLEYRGTQFVYVAVGEPVTISEGVVYNIIDGTALKRYMLSKNSAGLQTLEINLRMVTTTTANRVFYIKGNYISDVKTTGFEYPESDILLFVTVEKTEYDEPLIVVMSDELSNYYYYIRQQNTSVLGQAILGVMSLG